MFLAVLDQLGMDSGVVVCPQVKEGKSVLEPWAAGVLVGNDILLFDPRLGMALPGPHGHGIATLGQVRAQPELLRSLTIDRRYPYDITAEQVQDAQVWLVCSLSALAPRLQYPERLLAAHDHVKVMSDPAAQLARFKPAAASSGVEVRLWTEDVEGRSPLRLLRRFLPPREGGTDTALHKQLFMWQLLPWQYLPDAISASAGGCASRQYPAELLRGTVHALPLAACQERGRYGPVSGRSRGPAVFALLS